MKNKEKLILGSKLKNIVIATIISCFAFSGITFAINTGSTGYQLLNSNHKYIDKYSTVLKNTSSNKYFIPTKTDTEWNALLSHLPTGVSIVTPRAYSSNGQCPPRGDLWVSMDDYDGESFATQGSIGGEYKNRISSSNSFKGPHNWRSSTCGVTSSKYPCTKSGIIYRGEYVGNQWLCDGDVHIYKVIVVD